MALFVAFCPVFIIYYLLVIIWTLTHVEIHTVNLYRFNDETVPHESVVNPP